MTLTVTCEAKAFDVHELLLHFVADKLGLYADANLHVSLVDTTFAPATARLGPSFTVACGAAYLARRQAVPMTVVFVGVSRPMFWICSREVSNLVDLRGARLAGYGAPAPPYFLTRAALRSHGIDPDVDIQHIGCRDDAMRLGLLRANHVDAAVLSSAITPRISREAGVATIACVGDIVAFPSSGVAVHEEHLAEMPDWIPAIVRAHRASLDALHADPAGTFGLVSDCFGADVKPEDDLVTSVVQRLTQTGLVERRQLMDSLETLDIEEPPGTRVTVDDLYDFSLLAPEAD